MKQEMVEDSEAHEGLNNAQIDAGDDLRHDEKN